MGSFLNMYQLQRHFKMDKLGKCWRKTSWKCELWPGGNRRQLWKADNNNSGYFRTWISIPPCLPPISSKFYPTLFASNFLIFPPIYSNFYQTFFASGFLIFSPKGNLSPTNSCIYIIHPSPLGRHLIKGSLELIILCSFLLFGSCNVQCACLVKSLQWRHTSHESYISYISAQIKKSTSQCFKVGLFGVFCGHWNGLLQVLVYSKCLWYFWHCLWNF